MGLSPFSSEFSSLTQSQIMWVITNHYKDQSEDLEKYKLICRFVNPDAAKRAWDDEEEQFEETSLNSEFLAEIQKHTKSTLDPHELSDRVYNPEKYDVDTIERID